MRFWIQTSWPVPSIPIFKITGHELNVNGRTILKGIVRNLKDAQRQYNIMVTAQTEATMDAGTVVTVEGQTEGHEAEWATRNTKNPSVLTVKPTSIAGQPAPMPTRLHPDPTVQAKSEARMMAADDLKALSGIYDAALGSQGNETSGRAIFSRQQQSDTANFHFQDNLTNTIGCSTKMIVDLIPFIYTKKMTVRIIGEDDTHKMVPIYQPYDKNGKTVVHDFSVGKYDVICTAAPSFATRRREGAEAWINLVAQAPVLMNAAPDLIIKSLDIPYAKEISDRLKKTLPPQLQDAQDGQPEVPPEVAQKLQQYGQMVEALTQQVNKLTDEQKAKTAQLESQERIAAYNGQIQLAIHNAAETNKAAIAALTSEMEHIHKLMDQQQAMFMAQQSAQQPDQVQQ